MNKILAAVLGLLLSAVGAVAQIAPNNGGVMTPNAPASSGGSGVTSFNSRTGAVVPANGDYSIGQISGLGTGVATALGVNVGTAGSVVVNGGALGTPSSGVATNLTGTAAGLTAGNVSGTGVGSLASLAIGGATIGSNALAVTGSYQQFGGNFLMDGATFQLRDNPATTTYFRFVGGSGIQIGNTQYVAFSSTSNATGTLDTSISRTAAGTVGIGTGAAGSIAGGLQVATAALGGATIGTDALAVNGTMTVNTTVANNNVASFLYPTMANGTFAYFTLGRNGATNNWASLGFNYASNGSASNAIGLTFFGGSNVFSVNAAGAAAIPGSLALGGATIGSNVLQVNGGTSFFAGAVTFGGGITGTTGPTGAWSYSLNAGASTAVVGFTGTLFTGGTATTTFPQLLFQPTGTTAVTTWSTGGTPLGMNLVSGFAGNFLDFHVAGAASVFKVGSTGAITSNDDFTFSTGSSSLLWTGRTILRGSGIGQLSVLNSAATNSFILTAPNATATPAVQLGALDADTNASIVAQTLRTQGTLTGGTADQAGKDFTFIVSPGKGTGAGGSFIVQTAPAGSTGSTLNVPVTRLTIDSTGLVSTAGNASIGGNLTVAAAGVIQFSGRGILSSQASAQIQIGNGDVSSGAAAGILSFQGNTGSTTNGPLALIRGAGGGSSTSVGGELRLSGGLSSAAAGTGGAITFYTAPAASGNAAVLLATFASTGTATFVGSIGSGGATATNGDIVAGGGTGTSASGWQYWVGRSHLRSPADGIIMLANAADTDFTRLQFGGTTSSFPSIARSGTALQFKLADNSAFTSFTATTGILNALASDAGQTDATVCADSTTGQLYKGSGTLGICLGTSSARYKDAIRPQTAGLDQIVGLVAVNYTYKKGYGDGGAKTQYGFLAEDVVKVIPDLVGLDKDGRPNTVDLVGMIPVMVNAIKELKAKNDNLEMQLQKRVSR